MVHVAGPELRGGGGLSSNFASLKFSELLFYYIQYIFASQMYVCPPSPLK